MDIVLCMFCDSLVPLLTLKVRQKCFSPYLTFDGIVPHEQLDISTIFADSVETEKVYNLDPGF